MIDESDEYRRITRDLFRVRLDQAPNVDVRLIPGSIFPARLVLTLQDRPDLERALATPHRGAILELDMTEEVVVEIYRQIWKLAQTTGLPLPKLDKSQV